MFHEIYMVLISSGEKNLVSTVPKESSSFCVKLTSHLTEHNDPEPERLVWLFLFQRNDFQKESMQ